jgi:hypothetical protein
MAGLSLLEVRPVTGQGDRCGGVALASINIGRSFLLALARGSSGTCLQSSAASPCFPL